MTDEAPKAETAPATPEAPPPPEALRPALALFERGDFRDATASARALLSSPDAEVQAAARALLARMASDPWALRFGIAALALLALLVGIYVG
jgi:hypothetical protein